LSEFWSESKTRAFNPKDSREKNIVRQGYQNSTQKIQVKKYCQMRILKFNPKDSREKIFSDEDIK